MERDPDKLRLLEHWKALLQERHTVATFRDGQDLALQVAADLSRTIKGLEETAKLRQEAREEASNILNNELSELIRTAITRGISEPSILLAIRNAVTSLQPSKEHKAATVFLSYANADRDIVRMFASGLEKEGIRVWFDESSLKPGSQWVMEIERGLTSADVILFFISPSSVKSEWTKKELYIALHRQVSGESGTVIIPILLEEAEVPPLLRDIHWFDIRHMSIEEAIKGLVKVIDRSFERKSSIKQA